VAQGDAMGIHTASDALAPTKGALQVALASLVFQGNAKIAHIVAVEGWVMAPNAELIALEMSTATALAAGCFSLVCFMDSTMAMTDLVDPSLHSGQNSSLAACSTLWHWFNEDQGHTLHLWHVPSKEE